MSDASKPRRRWFAAVEREPRDCWVGVSWNRKGPASTVLVEHPCRARLDHAGGMLCALWVGHAGVHRHASPGATEDNIYRWQAHHAERLDVWVAIIPTLQLHLGWLRVPDPPGDIVRTEYRGLTLIDERDRVKSAGLTRLGEALVEGGRG